MKGLAPHPTEILVPKQAYRVRTDAEYIRLLTPPPPRTSRWSSLVHRSRSRFTARYSRSPVVSLSLSLSLCISLSLFLSLRELHSFSLSSFNSLPSPPLPSESPAKAQNRCRPSHHQQRQRQRQRQRQQRQPGILEEVGSGVVHLLKGKLPTLPGPCPPPCGSQTVAVVVMMPGSG